MLDYLRPYLPPAVPGIPSAQLGIQKLSSFFASKKAHLQEVVRALSSQCPDKLVGQEKALLDSRRAKALQDSAWALEQVGQSLSVCMQCLSILRQLDHGDALYRYMRMMNEVSSDFVSFTRKAAQEWDALYAETRRRQRQIDQMALDALSGTPYVKAYFMG
jgi:hypothetical protein